MHCAVRKEEKKGTIPFQLSIYKNYVIIRYFHNHLTNPHNVIVIAYFAMIGRLQMEIYKRGFKLYCTIHFGAQIVESLQSGACYIQRAENFTVFFLLFFSFLLQKVRLFVYKISSFLLIIIPL